MQPLLNVNSPLDGLLDRGAQWQRAAVFPSSPQRACCIDVLWSVLRHLKGRQQGSKASAERMRCAASNACCANAHSCVQSAT